MDSKIIVFEDNGIGLTEEEIHKFISILGESSKKDLISEKYKKTLLDILVSDCYPVSWYPRK